MYGTNIKQSLHIGSLLGQMFYYIEDDYSGGESLNSCFLLHVHKNLSDDLDIVSTEKEFIQNSHKYVIYFNYFLILI